MKSAVRKYNQNLEMFSSKQYIFKSKKSQANKLL